LWTWWNFTLTIELNVWRQIVGEIDFTSSFQISFQSELLGRSVNLAEVVDAGIATSCAFCLDEIGEANRRENADAGKVQKEPNSGTARYWQVPPNNQKPAGIDQTRDQNGRKRGDA
jgi:hypothetical protein